MQNQQDTKEENKTLEEEKKEINNELKEFFRPILSEDFGKVNHKENKEEAKKVIKEILQRINKSWKDEIIREIIEKIENENKEELLFEILDDYYYDKEEKNEEEKKIELRKWLETIKEITNYSKKHAFYLIEIENELKKGCEELTNSKEIDYYIRQEKDETKTKEKVDDCERKCEAIIDIVKKKNEISEELIKKNDKGEIDIRRLSELDKGANKKKDARSQILSKLKHNINFLISAYLDKIVCNKVKLRVIEKINKKLREEAENLNYPKLVEKIEKINKKGTSPSYWLIINLCKCENSNLDVLIKIKENLILTIKKYHYEEANSLFKKEIIKRAVFESRNVLEVEKTEEEWVRDGGGQAVQLMKEINIRNNKEEPKNESIEDIHQSWPIINDLLFFQARSLNLISAKTKPEGKSLAQGKNKLRDFLFQKERKEERTEFDKKFENLEKILKTVPWLSSESMEKIQETKIDELSVEKIQENKKEIEDWINKIKELLDKEKFGFNSEEKTIKKNLETLLLTLEKIKKIKEEIIEILKLNITNIIPKDCQFIETPRKSPKNSMGRVNQMGRVKQKGKQESKKEELTKEEQKTDVKKEEEESDNNTYLVLFVIAVIVVPLGIMLGIVFWWYTTKRKTTNNISEDDKN